MLDTMHAALARELDHAERTRVQLEHFSKNHSGMTIADSYAIHREWMKLKRAAGQQVIGHEIGLTSRAMQIAPQITEPDYAPRQAAEGPGRDAVRRAQRHRPCGAGARTHRRAHRTVRPYEQAGDTFHADYGPLGSISVRFV